MKKDKRSQLDAEKKEIVADLIAARTRLYRLDCGVADRDVMVSELDDIISSVRRIDTASESD